MIEARAASLVYQDHGRDVFAVRELSVAIQPGEFVGILGPSGSGKSSMLYLLSGLKQPTAGSIRYGDRDLASMSDAERSGLRLSEFGFVFQLPFLLGYLSALENVMVAVDPGAHQPQSEALTLLDRLGMKDKAHRLPHELSGGERQRVCVARALMGQPSVVFADEPTAALDHKNGEQVVGLLNENRGQASLVMVTHDPTMLKHADRVLHIDDGVLIPAEAHV
jgi:putative ABC transport system ATP-binding protein